MVHATLFDVIAVSALLNPEVATASVRLRRGWCSSAAGMCSESKRYDFMELGDQRSYGWLSRDRPPPMKHTRTILSKRLRGGSRANKEGSPQRSSSSRVA